MCMPKARLLWIVDRGYSDDTIARIAMAAIAGPTGAPPGCLAVNRAQQTLQLLNAQWSPQVPTLHLSAPASGVNVVRAVLFFATLYPVPVVAVGCDGSLPGFSWAVPDRGHDKAMTMLPSWSVTLLGNANTALPFLVGVDAQASLGVSTLWMVVPLPAVPAAGLIPTQCWLRPADVASTHLRRCASLTIHKLQSFVGPSRALSDFFAARLVAGFNTGARAPALVAPRKVGATPRVQSNEVCLARCAKALKELQAVFLSPSTGADAPPPALDRASCYAAWAAVNHMPPMDEIPPALLNRSPVFEADLRSVLFVEPCPAERTG